MRMTEDGATEAILEDFGVPIEIFQRFPSLLTLAGGHFSILLDHYGSYRRWLARQGIFMATIPVESGIGRPGSLRRQFYDEEILPLKIRAQQE